LRTHVFLLEWIFEMDSLLASLSPTNPTVPHIRVQKKYDPVPADESHNEMSSETWPEVRPSWKKIHTTGWRFGVISCALATISVFTLNLIFMLWAVGRHESGVNGNQILYQGDCNTVHKLNSVVHIFINVFGTTLLSCSNYCMQCLSAPTRKEADSAHQNKGLTGWVDIGVLSIRNLRRIDRRRVVLWLVLSLSSLPLHLL
jgi:hypothetical protein